METREKCRGTSGPTTGVPSHGGFGGASLARIEAIGLDLGYTLLKRFRIVENDPLSARAEFVQNASLRRGDWSVRIEYRTRMTSSTEVFHFSTNLSAYEGAQCLARRTWSLAIPRALV